MIFKNKDRKEESPIDFRDSDGDGYTASPDSSYEDIPNGSFGGEKRDFVSQEEASPYVDRNPVKIAPAEPPALVPGSVTPETIALEFKRLNSRVDSIANWIKQFHSSVSESLEVVREIKEKISRVEDVDSNLNSLYSRLESMDQEFDVFNRDIEDLKKRADVFIGAEELLKLNDSTNQNLQELRRMEGEVRPALDKLKGVDLGALTANSISTDLLEKTAILAKQNKESIGKFTFIDYNEKIDSILKVIENLADEVADIKSNLKLQGKRASFNNPSKGGDGRGSGADKVLLKKSDMDILEDIGDVSELPELPHSKSRKDKKNKKKNKK